MGRFPASLACGSPSPRPTPDSPQPRTRRRLRLPNPVQDDNLHSICDASSVSDPSQHSGGIEHSHKQQGGLSVCELRLSVQQSHVPGQVWENSGELQDCRQHWSHLVLRGLEVAVPGQAAQCQVQPIRARLELPSLLDASSTQRSGFGSSSNFQQGVICKGSRCSPVGGSFPSSSSGQFVSGSGSYGSSGSFGSSGSYQTGSIANCRHGQNCNVG